MPEAADHEPLSIALVLGSASRAAGGLLGAVSRLAKGLAACGHQITVISLRDSFTDEDRHEWHPLEPVVLNPVGPKRLGYSPALGHRLGRRRFHIVHQHGLWQAFSMAVLKQAKNGTPTLISPHGMLDPWALRQSAWKKRVMGMLCEDANLRGAACLHALNTQEANAIRSFGLTRPVAVIANGADLPEATPTRPPRWWPGGRVLLFLGRIHAKKGVVELVEAFARFSASAPKIAAPWSVVIAGWDDGGHRDELAAAIAHHGLQDRVLLPGPLYGAEKNAALCAAEAFVLPSYSEGLPMSVLEAWSWSLPVLMTRACNLPDGFAAGAAVEIETDPAALSSVLRDTLARSASELAAVGARGRAHVAAFYGWDKIAAAHAAVYRWIAAGSAADARPRCIG